MRTFRLPDLGEGLTDAEIVAWHVAEGDRVVADQPLVSLETEKAVVEVPAPWSGRILKLHAAPGDVIEVGAALADLDVDEAREDAGAVVGELQAAPAKARATPAVRAHARSLGVALDGLVGTGPDGAITRRDVEAAAAPAREGFEPLRGVRRRMARNMSRARAEVAAATVTDEVDVSHWPADPDVTVRLLRALVAAARAEPALNAWYDGEREARRLHQLVNVGVAMDTGEGLFVPVLRDVGARDQADLRAALDVVASQVAERSVTPEALLGATITLSNFGTIAGRHAALVVVPPQVAIVGAGRITLEPRVVDGEVRPRRVLPLSLSFDHRAVSGGEAARYLAALIRELQR